MQSSGDATGSFKRNSTQQEKMRHLLVLLIFALILTVPCCGKGDTKMPLDEGVKINRETANAFMRRQKRSPLYYERYYETLKSPMEMKHERCENYLPCDYYSERVGFHVAYNYFFGRV